MSTLRINNPLWGFLNNPYPRPNDNWLYNHIPGKEVKKDPKSITREEKEHFFPKENKTSNHLLQVSDFVKEPADELKKIFHEKWANDLFSRKAEEKSGKYFESLVKSGFNCEQAKSNLDYAGQNIQRIKTWAHDNEKVGKVASTFMSFAIPLGIIRNIISNLDFISPIIQKTISFLYTLTSSMRGYYQYSDKVYNRADDEVAMNKYQAEVYGNKVARSLGNAACIMETKVNLLILPIISLFTNSKELLDSAISILTIPNLSWWRGRMLAHINQEYLTDLIRYIFHKPLSLIGRKESKKAIEGIKQRRNLEKNYIIKRHYENIGLKDKEDQKPTKLISRLFKSIRNAFNKDPTVQQESAKKAGETIAPTFGFIAFISTIIGAPLRVLFKYFNKQNRITDFFNSLSLSCQQCIYFFKMIVPAIGACKHTKSELSKTIKEKDKINLTLLYSKLRNLSWLGIVTFSSSILNTTLKLFKIDNQFFEKIKSTIEGLSGDLVSKFFSERRHVLGFQFKAENAEFYEEEVETKSMSSTEIKDKPELRVVGVDGKVREVM